MFEKTYSLLISKKKKKKNRDDECAFTKKIVTHALKILL